MYAGNYGLPNAIPPAGSQYNGGAPHPASHNHHLQPGQGHPNQASMYNQQFPMGAQAAVGFPGVPNMMSGPGPAGMMQNTGMPHMAAVSGPMPNYQPPYTNSPYGAGIPSSVAPQMNIPPSYMGGGMAMSAFPMHHGMNPQQQMMQRMQPPLPNTPGMSTPTPQRTFQNQSPQSQTPHSTPTPNNAPNAQQHPVSTPQNAHSTPQNQTPNNAQRQQQQQQQLLSNNIPTPQTPTFPVPTQNNGPNNASSASTPLSPGADSRDKERVGVILEINNELLLEAMQIQNTQRILKEERASANGTDGVTSEPEKKPTEEDMLAQDYLQCMRRLQTNLTYLAALADKKGNVTAGPCPSYLRAPPLNTSIKLRMMVGPDGSENQEAPDRGETAKYIQELYKKLQALYPGMDPNKEPTLGLPGGRQNAQQANAAKPGPPRTPGQPSPGGQQTPKMATSAPPSSMTNIAGP
ncbi:uncharacterized protein F4812DRAFT_461573 [Daldinia caldariorum]|uniref:uncharacterized protein n=1 Tax=Daldinia caldariorum TaxID=326644 RepID=UPI0020079B9F|nr:uncharacterized protein F4812DRAFT_461573 [Daldinia caldariorum]KAI1465886.1 hypothetical protein F4812DRAFT_461573 [Daldinia caldariorum]